MNRLGTTHQNKQAGPWYRGPYFILTLTVFTVVLVYPLLSAQESPYLHDAMISALLFSSLYATVDMKWVFRSLAVLLLPILIGTWGFVEVPGQLANKMAAIGTLLFLLVTNIAVLTHVIVARRITADMIFGSVAVYLLVGINIALLLMFIHYLAPGSVLDTLNPSDPWTREVSNFSTLLYFSMITLTSVGYGDAVPSGQLARSIAVFTGIFGQLYVAILVAKLVGLYTAQVMTAHGRDSSPHRGA